MVGFVGAGNIATALIHGMIGGGVDPNELSAFDIDSKKLDALRDIGVVVFHSLESIAQAADTLVLAVKPYHCASVLSSLDNLKWCGNLISVAAGWSQKSLQNALPSAGGVLQMMPNTPSRVGDGVIAVNGNHTLDAPVFDHIQSIFSKCGIVMIFPEPLFDAVISISGSGPAYAYLFIEALADAGVREGLPRQQAYELGAQTLLGAASMVLKTGRHPGALKDDVCSPGGTTIEAIGMLEKAGFRSAVMDAVRACAKKARRMTRQSEKKST